MSTKARLAAALKALLETSQDAILCSRRDWRRIRLAQRELEAAQSELRASKAKERQV